METETGKAVCHIFGTHSPTSHSITERVPATTGIQEGAGIITIPYTWYGLLEMWCVGQAHVWEVRGVGQRVGQRWGR